MTPKLSQDELVKNADLSEARGRVQVVTSSVKPNRLTLFWIYVNSLFPELLAKGSSCGLEISSNDVWGCENSCVVSVEG